MRRYKNRMANAPVSAIHHAPDPLQRKQPFFTQEELLEVMLGDFIPHVSTARVVFKCGGDYNIPSTYRG